MRTFVSPIGYNTTSVTRALLDVGLEADDRIVLVRPHDDSDDNRAAEAITDVERYLTEVEPSIEFDTERVPHGDFDASIAICSDLLRDVEGTLVVNLGGGARDVLLPLAIAAVAHADLIDRVLSFSDVDGAVREWDLPRLADLPSGPELETLDVIAQNGDGNSIPELTELRDVSKTTVTRHVNELDDAGAVETWDEGKTKFVKATVAGQLALDGPVGDDRREP